MRNPVERVKIIKAKILLINAIIEEFAGNLNKILADERVLRPAVLMHLVAISEQIDKLKEENSFEILEKFSRSDLKGINDMRNFIAHDYEGVDLAVVETALKYGLPSLEKSVDKILKKSEPQVKEPAARYSSGKKKPPHKKS